MKFILLAIIWELAAFYIPPARGDIISDRITQCLDTYIASPDMNPATPDIDRQYDAKAGYALVAMARGSTVSSTVLSTARDYIHWLCTNQPVPDTGDADVFYMYFYIPLLQRIYLDSSMSQYLTPREVNDIKQVCWDFVEYRSKVSTTNNCAQTSVFNRYRSENHNMHNRAVFLIGLQILRDAGSPYGGTRTLADGQDVNTHLAVWKKHFDEYFRQQAREGLNAEIASPGYNSLTLQCWYNVMDFVEDEILAAQAKKMITLFWADYACDFLPGIGLRGTGGCRWYKLTEVVGNTDNFQPTLFAYGWHDNHVKFLTPASLMPLMSQYRMPDTITSCATGYNKSPYTHTTRRFGMGVNGTDGNGITNINFDPDNNSQIRKDTYWTKDYVIGTVTWKAEDIYAEEQNRVEGILFNANIPDRIIMYGKGTGQSGNAGYQEISGVCGTKCFIGYWLKVATSNAGMRIFLPNGPLKDNLADDTNWVFTRTGTMGAGRYEVADGTDNEPNRDNYLVTGTNVSPWAGTEPVIAVSGYSGNCLSFDGTNDVAFARHKWAGYNNVALDFYFKTDTATNPNTQVLINSTDTWQVVLVNNDLTFTIWTKTGSRYLSINDAVLPNIWYHIQASIDAAGHMSFTLNSGNLRTSEGLPMKALYNDIVLGNKSGYTRLYKGKLDKVKIMLPSYNYKVIASWDMESLVNRDVYVGMRIATPDYPNYTLTTDTKGVMLDLTDLKSPVVFEVAGSSDYATFDAFKAACKNNAVTNFKYSSSKLIYTSLAGQKFEVWANSTTLPKIQDVTVDLNPLKTYDSPYLQGVHGMDTVTISYPGYSDVMLNFCYHDSPAWDDYKTVALWHMDANSAGMILDDNIENALRHKDLTLYNGLTVTTGNGGKFSEALNFDGMDDYGSVANGWASSTSFQADLWIYPTDSTGTHVLVSAANIWSIDITDGKLGLWTSNSNGSNSYLRFSTDISLNTWHRVLANCDSQGNRMLIIDNASICDNVGAGLLVQAAAITVGSTTGPANYYAGMIDDIKISNYASVPASMSGDLTHDKSVDYFDFAQFAGQWLNSCDEQTWCNDADIDHNHSVDFVDLAGMTANWLIDGTALSIP